MRCKHSCVLSIIRERLHLESNDGDVSFRTFLTEECFEMVHYAEPGKKSKWGYFPSEGHPEVVTKFEGIKDIPEFL